MQYVDVDESQYTEDCSYGAYVSKDECRRIIRNHDEASIITAEPTTIKHALRYVAKRNLRSSVIMSDSRSILESMQNREHPTNTHPTILDILDELDKLRKAEVNTKFYWIKDHVEMKPSIVADCSKKIH
ncbi:hypothetical protein Trydic_g8840 [Trypoxylus dichotomus]